MERNKEEATRAKTVSEKMFLEMDIDGAMKFALKAQELYPNLDGLSQLLATLEVSLSAQKKINGEVDWYAVLDVEPSADVETMRKHYRKLALVLHPDKNKSVGADGAFKLISEAWSVLSDKDKREAYDEKRNLSIDGTIPDEEPSVPVSEPVFYDFFGSSQSDAHPNSIPMSSVSLKESFWTMCNACSTMFEYSIVYVNCKIRCLHCLQPFLALELDPSHPNRNASYTSTVSQVQGKNFNSSQMDQTFWTMCSSCMTRFEYNIIYINSRIRCFRCHRPFLAFGEHSLYMHKNASFTSTTSQIQGQDFDSSQMERTFWTSCRSCTTQLEYMMIYVNQKLRCPRCRQPFIAFETDLSHTHRNALSTLLISHMQGPEFNSSQMERDSEEAQAFANNVSQKNFGSFSSFMTGAVHKNSSPNAVISQTQDQFNASQQKLNSSVSGGAPVSATNMSSSVPISASSVAEAPGDPELPSGHLKRACEDMSPSQSSCFGSGTSPEVDRPTKKMCMDEHRDVNAKGDTETGMSSQYEGMGLVSCSTGHPHNETMTSEEVDFDSSKINGKEATTRENDDSKNVVEPGEESLLEFVDSEALGNDHTEISPSDSVDPVVCASEGITTEEVNFDSSKINDKEVIMRDENDNKNVVEPGEEGLQEFSDSETVDNDRTKISLVNSASKGIGFRCTEVPDPDFHNFDNERTVESFGEKQVWAAYDDDDIMPRYYALIHSVLSHNPFEVKFSWLNSRRNGELAPFKWVKSGYYKTAGNFRIGKYQTTHRLRSFSHRVDGWTKGVRGVIQIYPMKGDVWALFSNWSFKWNIFTEDEVIHKYEMVEVLEDYNKQRGVIVSPLIKVPNFKTVFRRCGDARKIRSIPKEEMFRFSHQVPSHILTGEEGPNAPRGCIELDPASLTEELYKELTKEEVERAFGGTSEDGSGPGENPRGAKLVERSQATNGEHAAEDIVTQTKADAIRKKASRFQNLVVYKRKRFRKTRKARSGKYF